MEARKKNFFFFEKPQIFKKVAGGWGGKQSNPVLHGRTEPSEDPGFKGQKAYGLGGGGGEGGAADRGCCSGELAPSHFLRLLGGAATTRGRCAGHGDGPATLGTESCSR